MLEQLIEKNRTFDESKHIREIKEKGNKRKSGSRKTVSPRINVRDVVHELLSADKEYA